MESCSTGMIGCVCRRCALRTLVWCAAARREATELFIWWEPWLSRLRRTCMRSWWSTEDTSEYASAGNKNKQTGRRERRGKVWMWDVSPPKTTPPPFPAPLLSFHLIPRDYASQEHRNMCWLAWPHPSAMALFYSFSCMLLCRIFLSLVESAGLTDLLKQEGDFTLFAPSDKAFRGVSHSDMAILTGMVPLSKCHRCCFIW